MLPRVVSIVISFHLLCMAALLFAPSRTPALKTAHIKVRTVRPVIAAPKKVSSLPVPAPVSAPILAPTPRLKNKPSPVGKKHPSPPVKKIAPPMKKPAVIEKKKPVKKITQPQKPAVSAEVWDEIDQALAKIEKKSYPERISSLESMPFTDKAVEEEEEDHSRLVGFLHDALHLPEVGEVKIQLTVRKDGTVAKVVVLSSASYKNKLYLQEHLPRLRFPMHFEKEKTWTLAFCNEI